MKARALIAILFVVSYLMGGCGAPESHSKKQLSLLCSLSWQDDARLDRIGLTNSMVYVLKLMSSGDSPEGLLLLRTRFTSPGITDSFWSPSPDVDWLLSGLEEFRLPESDRLFLLFPLGDTSGMLRFGQADAAASPEGLEYELLSERFYLVDLGYPEPRTIAVIEGYIVDAAWPFLAVLTSAHRRESPSGMEVLAINLDQLRVAARIPLDQKDPGQIKNSIELTDDGKLLVADFDTTRIYKEDVAVYVTEKDTIMGMVDYYHMLDSCMAFENKLLKFLDVGRQSWLTDLVFRRAVRLRAYGVGFCPQQVLVWDLFSSETTRQELILPGGILGSALEDFSASDGRNLFLLTPEQSSSYYYPMGNLPRNYPHVPALSDLKKPPFEATWFRGFKHHRPYMQWELSAQKRWLVLYQLDKEGVRKEAFILPVEALTDSAFFSKYRSFVRIPLHSDNARLSFVPGEEWVLVHQKEQVASPLLYRCSSPRPSIPLLSEIESEADEVCFSPDGRYIGYVCRIKGKGGYHLQVRRLPE